MKNFIIDYFYVQGYDNFNLDYAWNKNTFDTGDHLTCCCFISCVVNYLTNQGYTSCLLFYITEIFLIYYIYVWSLLEKIEKAESESVTSDISCWMYGFQKLVKKNRTLMKTLSTIEEEVRGVKVEFIWGVLVL